MDSSHTGRFTADFAKPTRTISEYAQQAVPIHVHPPPTKIEFISHPYSSERRIVLENAHSLEPWTQPSFIPLPDYVVRYLHDVDLVEMPKKTEFEAGLQVFRKNMMEPLRETAFFPADRYAVAARSLATGDMSMLSDRVRSWALVHRLSSVSDKYNVILVPRDSVYSMDAASAEAHRQQFVTDLLSGKNGPDHLQYHHYDRLPVQNQLYDILTYVHRSHLPAAQMLIEIDRLRFAFITWPMAEMYVRMCPLCNMRAKQLQEQAHQSISAA
ncbi:hypothetical protein NLJ89_g5512 [Agrocybe chaxingu]|uniref:Uncharacterized protein n=1 Tax=Agrocybe chaxingu TaxID=84603 RepID=A0A9W8K0X9_9AGAR|nr:hypothetical protein NLJ89_g5512 [Agrocybe chaxingu]